MTASLTVKPRASVAKATPKRRRGTGLSPSGKTVSRRQQRYLFARFGAAARKYTTKGRYAHLPERSRKSRSVPR
jgi:hypothetical protein